MAQISKRELKNEIKKEIIDNLWISLITLSKDEEVTDFIDDLLTPTEKIMLAKRLAIAILLLREWKYKDIKDFLKVSGSTIYSVHLNVEKGGRGFRFIINQLEKRKSITKNIRRFERSFLPPIVGRGRWSGIHF